jgi:hypothetical protein
MRVLVVAALAGVSLALPASAAAPLFVVQGDRAVAGLQIELPASNATPRGTASG